MEYSLEFQFRSKPNFGRWDKESNSKTCLSFNPMLVRQFSGTSSLVILNTCMMHNYILISNLDLDIRRVQMLPPQMGNHQSPTNPDCASSADPNKLLCVDFIAKVSSCRSVVRWQHSSGVEPDSR
ncbi:hypothetical protein NL676_004254 [Syzygium grande]|nr:hypothetical protein NL676_004254 [Syzygium grande]